MKISRIAFIPLLFIAAPALGQNTLPQPAPLVNTIPDPQDIPYPGTMTIAVDATDTERGIFRVKQAIPVAKSGPMVLQFSKWLPGKHAPRGEIEKLAGLQISANGRTIAWRRDNLDVYAFHIDVPNGARQLDIAFEFVSATNSDQGRIVVTPAMMNLQFEMVSLYPAGYFARRIPVKATVTYPAGWKAASGLPARATGSTYAYETTDYETLIDSPVFAGRHFRQFELTPRVRLNVVADEAKFLEATPEQIDTHKRLVDQSVKVFGSQPYDKYEFLLALTKQMGGIGLEHHRSSENGVNPEYFTEWDKGPGRRNLLPHEFAHSWNGKYRRPAGNWTPDFNTPMNDDLLWVYEGQDQFWGYVLGARSGIFTKQETLDALANIAASLDVRRGRDWRPLRDTTHDPVISPRKPKAWVSQQRSEDYYNEGMLVWLEADAIIRGKTNGAKGLDDFARSFFGGRDGDWGTATYTFDDVVAALNGVVGHDWATLLTQRLTETAKNAPLSGFTMGGYRLAYSDQPNLIIKDSERTGEATELNYSLGLTVAKSGKVSQVIWGSPAFDHKLALDDEIVSVNDRAYSGDAIKAAVTAARDGKTPVRLLVKSGDRYREVSIDYRGGLRYPRFEKRVPERAAWTSFCHLDPERSAMNIDLIPVGDNPPESLNVIIEVPVGGEPVKYEFDKKSGALFVDRILHTPMRYPANYGFVPHTLSPDGDPLDALVVARSPFVPGCVVRARPIGVLKLEDEAGGDEKLVCVPVDTTFPYYSDVGERQDLPSIVLQQIEHFFKHYKDLESEKWVRIGSWGDADEARQIVLEAIEAAKKAKAV